MKIDPATIAVAAMMSLVSILRLHLIQSRFVFVPFPFGVLWISFAPKGIHELLHLFKIVVVQLFLDHVLLFGAGNGIITA